MSENYSLKEMVQEVRDSQKSHEHTSIKIATTVENIEIMFKQMAIRVDDHEKRIVEQEGFKGKVIMVWGVIVFVLTTIANKVMANISL